MILHTPRALTSRPAVRRPRAGFTLLEVLVVVAIIVMLAGVGGYYVLQQYETTKYSRAKIDAEALSTMAETFKLNNGEYPATIEALAAPQPSGHPALCAPEKLLDPWNKPFQIDPTGQHNGGNKADIFTVAPNGQVIGNFRQQ
jgi:general secretion pathway protein G